MQQHKKKSYGDRDDIDDGLPDTWLGKVNSLKHWKVTSTCEGHPQSTKAYACLSLTPHDSIIDVYADVFGESHSEVEELARNCFQHPDTDCSIKCFVDGVEVAPPIEIHSANSPRDRVAEELGVYAFLDKPDPQGTILNLSIRHAEPRTSSEIPLHVLAWLDRVVTGLISFDSQCAQLCSPNCASRNVIPV